MALSRIPLGRITLDRVTPSRIDLDKIALGWIINSRQDNSLLYNDWQMVFGGQDQVSAWIEVRL